MNISRQKPIKGLNPETKEEISFDSIKEASEYFKCDKGNLHRALKSGVTYNNMLWEYDSTRAEQLLSEALDVESIVSKKCATCGEVLGTDTNRAINFFYLKSRRNNFKMLDASCKKCRINSATKQYHKNKKAGKK